MPGRVCYVSLNALRALAPVLRTGRGHFSRCAGLIDTLAKMPQLSFQEKAVLRLVARGLANKEVGLELRISERTVGAYLERAYLKLAVRSRAGAVTAWLRVEMAELQRQGKDPQAVLELLGPVNHKGTPARTPAQPQPAAEASGSRRK